MPQCSYLRGGNNNRTYLMGLLGEQSTLIFIVIGTSYALYSIYYCYVCRWFQQPIVKWALQGKFFMEGLSMLFSVLGIGVPYNSDSGPATYQLSPLPPTKWLSQPPSPSASSLGLGIMGMLLGSLRLLWGLMKLRHLRVFEQFEQFEGSVTLSSSSYRLCCLRQKT